MAGKGGTRRRRKPKEEVQGEGPETEGTRQATRESGERYRNLFNTIDEGFCIIEMIFDAEGRPVDYRFLEVNAAFEKQTGLHDAEGKFMRELAPAHEAHWFEMYGKIALTGEPARFTNQAKALNRWYDVYAYRVGRPEDRQVAILFNDISGHKQVEEALKKSEMILNDTGHIARIGGWEHDLVTGKATWTKALYEIEELESGPPPGPAEHLNQYPPRYRATLEAAYRQAVETGAPFDLELQVYTARKHLIWGKVIGRPVMENGRCVRMVGTFQDITDRKQVEEALRESEEKYRTVFENTGNATVVVEENNLISLANAEFVHLAGYSREEIEGKKSWTEFVVREDLERMVAQHRLRRKNREKALRNYEFRFLRRGGDIRNVHLTIDLIPGTTKSVASLLDFTDRVKIETALRESEERLRLAQQVAHVGTFEWNIQTGVNRWSPELESMYGLAPGSFSGTQEAWENMVYPEDRPEAVRRVGEAMYTGGFEGEWRVIWPDGTVHWLYGRARVLKDVSGKPLRLIGVNIDITRRKETEKRIAHLASFPELNPNPLLELDLSGKLLYSNPATARVLEEARAGNDPRVFLPQDLRTLLPVVIEGGTPVDREVPVGDRIFLETLASPPRMGVIRIFARDITERKRAEEEIARLASFPELNPNPVLEMDPTGRITFANAATATSLKHLGVPNDLSLFIPGDRDAILRLLNESSERQVYREVIVGDAIFAENISLNRTYNVIRIYAREITETKRGEVQLRDTTAYLDNLLNYANSPIIVWDPELRVTRFNHAFERLTGMQSSGVIGKTVGILFPKGSREKSMDLIRSTMTGPRWELIEVPIQRTDGSVRTVLWNSANLFGPDQKTLLATIAQGQDVTEQKKAEEALRETSAYLQNLIDYANTPIIVWDPDLRITRFNHAFEGLTGLASESTIGRTVDILFPEESREESLTKIRSSMTGRRWELIEVPIQRTDGSVRTVLWNSANLFGPDQKTLIATIAQGQDVTDLRKATLERENLIEELERKNAELERFTYTVSHDLKSPLITIKGFLGFLEEDARSGNSEQLNTDIARIQHAADVMQDLLGDLLQLSRIGRIVNPPTRISFRDLAREAVELVGAQIRKKEVKVEIAPDFPDVYGDRARLLEVMQNLVENAVKFMGYQAEPKVEIGIRYDQGTPVFFVRDNGIGIDPKFRSKIFGLFEKLDRKTEGTGVGLALVKRIIEHHGGRIWVDSEGVGKGSTFWFTLSGSVAEAAKDKVEEGKEAYNGNDARGSSDHPSR
jgi:two-component system sensor kinase FixL